MARNANASRVAKELDKIPTVQLLVGVFSSRASGGMVNVDFGDGPVTILTAGFVEPVPGQSVQCLRITDKTVMLGLSMPRALIGVVTGTGSPLMTVTTSLGSESLPKISTFTPVIGDSVLILGGYVIGKVSVVAAGSYTAPTSTISDFSADFRAADSGSYQSGSWNKTDVWASDSNSGAWLYDLGSDGLTIIAGTIPDAATITRVQVYLPEFYNAFPSELAAIGTHTLGSKAGAPTLSNLVGIPNVVPGNWVDLPTTIGDLLKTGAVKGIGVQQAVALHGFHKYTGRASDADSGLLRIDWTV